MPLRKYTNNLETCAVNGATVGEVVKQIGEQFSELKDKLLREDGTLRAHFIIFLDDKDIRMLERESTPVSADSVLRIVPAIAGG